MSRWLSVAGADAEAAASGGRPALGALVVT